MQFHEAFCSFILRPNILPSTLFSYTIDLCSSFMHWQ